MNEAGRRAPVAEARGWASLVVVGALALASALLLAACGKERPGKEAAVVEGSAAPREGLGRMTVVLETSMGDMTALLFGERTPRTVENFLTLSEKGFYEGLIFHRVIAGFMIQTGCPEGTGRGGPGYTFADEIVPGLTHSKAGILSMANSGPNTNGSQFFITVAPTPWLDGKHTVFGEVTEGLDVALAISKVATDQNDRPLTPVTLKRVRIVGPPPPAD